MTKTLDWRKLPDLVFNDAMLIVGHQRIEDLNSCRQVCRAWNSMIMNKIWENPTKKWGTIIQRRIERSWERIIVSKDYDYDYDYDYPSDEKISQAIMLGKDRHQNQNIKCLNILFWKEDASSHLMCLKVCQRESEKRL